MDEHEAHALFRYFIVFMAAGWVVSRIVRATLERQRAALLPEPVAPKKAGGVGSKARDDVMKPPQDVAIAVDSGAAVPYGVRNADGSISVYVDQASSVRPEKGTPMAPFASISAACSKGLATLASQQCNTNGITVWIASGIYTFTETLYINASMSGTSDATRVVFRPKDPAAGSVVFSGGTVLDQSKLAPVTDATFKARLIDQSVLGKIREMDISEYAGSLGTPAPHGWSLEPPTRVPVAALYQDGERQTLARWPRVGQDTSAWLDERDKNRLGMLSFTKVSDVGATKADVAPGNTKFNDPTFNNQGGSFILPVDRFKLWHEPENVFLDGCLSDSWCWTYNQIKSVDPALKQVTVKRGELSGITGAKGSYMYFENIPEEIAGEGDYYIDRANNKLFYYPPAAPQGDLILSTLSDNIVSVNDASFITFQHIEFRYSRKNAVGLRGADSVTMTDCLISNVSLAGVDMNATNCTVVNSEIFDTGAGGVVLAGGTDVKFKHDANNHVTELIAPCEMVPSGNVVSGCVIHDVAWDQKSQVPMVTFGEGCGHRVEGTEMYNAPHFAVNFRDGSQCVMENNYIHDLPNYQQQDGGSVYFEYGTNPMRRGNKVVGNYFENVPTNGVYIDNFASGVEVTHNVFNKVAMHPPPAMTIYTFGCINVNGGGQNNIHGNYFYNAAFPINGQAFAVTKLFPIYYPFFPAVKAAVTKFGIANTPLKNFPDFADVWMSFSTEDDYRYQTCRVGLNVAVNPTAPLAPKGPDPATGVRMCDPKCKWTIADTKVLHQLTPAQQAVQARIAPILSVAPLTAWKDTVVRVTSGLDANLNALVA